MIEKLTDLPSVNRYLYRIGGEARSILTAVVKDKVGAYWKDLAVIRFSRTGDVDCTAQYATTESERNEIKVDFSKTTFPDVLPCAKIVDAPEMILNAQDKDIFKFFNEYGQIVMIQVRMERDGEKSYVPWTYWTDNKWRCAEPEGSLPLWGIDQLAGVETVFVHEGAKAARAVADMIKNPSCHHPWVDELRNAAHIGWIGGALSPHRTDWGVLKKTGIKKVFIVSDNDAPGVAAVPSIAYALHCPTFHVQFTQEWPVSFDLADDFPEKMFSSIGHERFYTGPSFRSCLHPATWATDLKPNHKGKPTAVLRDSFTQQWVYADAQDLYVCVDLPEIVRTEAVLNKMLSAFSHSSNTASILQKHYQGRSAHLCYRPDINGRIVTNTNGSGINLHTPGYIKSRNGDVQPFLDFMTYLCPKKDEQESLLDWCTTLIAHPDIKMDFGLLLVSETQGVGKTTLGSSILAPLVGAHNVSYPSENMIVSSDFNEWLVNKRLIIANEIYSGHSWKAYNKLKSIITDRTVDVNKKFQNTYTIENWSHMIACSNSMRALKIESGDRRWFYPEITEAPWGKNRFTEFHGWLFSGGLSIVKGWAEKRPTWVQPGDRAPMTSRKKSLIEGSRTEAQTEACKLAEAINAVDRPIALAMKDVISWVRSQCQGKVFDSDLEIRKAMRDSGCILREDRVRVSGLLQYVILNKNHYWGDKSGADVKEKIVKPSEIIMDEF